MQAPWSDYNVSVDSNNNLVVNNGTDDTRNITVEMVYLLQFNSEPEKMKIFFIKGESLFLHCPGRTFDNYPDDNKVEIR